MRSELKKDGGQRRTMTKDRERSVARGATTIGEVEARLRLTTPRCDDGDATLRAGVAAILRPGVDDLELLFIRRAEHDADPWSGHLAFPGGRIDPGDADARIAAERETEEEVGLDLVAANGAHYLGRLSDVMGHAESICVAAHVYAIEGDPSLRPNYEVREAFWSPLAHLTDPDRQAVREFRYQDVARPLPTIRLLEDEAAPVLWGITYKIVDDLMSTIERPIPYMPWEAEDVL
jgi:8-oxo-dGTP pyrophosphatase MutT (NUDIX family)